MTLAEISARCQRLGALVRGINLEMSLIGHGDDPLLFLERQAYLAALRCVVAGLETARLVLATARQRIAGSPGR